MAHDPWIRNLDAFTQALGVENAGAIFTFAKVGWRDDKQRDEFIKDLTNVDLRTLQNFG
jgi:hypothetical protein